MGEEGLNGLENAIKIIDPTLNKNGQITYNISLCKKTNKVVYEIMGLESDKYDKFYYSLSAPKGKGTFVDLLFFETRDSDLISEGSEPFYAIEVTKGDGNSSGNMTEQRAAKFNRLKEYSNKCRFAYLVECNASNLKDQDATFGDSHQKTLELFKMNKISTFYSQIGHFGIEEKISFGPKDNKSSEISKDIFEHTEKYHKGSPPKPHSSRTPYWLKLERRQAPEKNKWIITASLSKKQNGQETFSNDPAQGFIASRIQQIMKDDPDSEILISPQHRLSNKELEKLLRSNTKLTRALNHGSVTIIGKDGKKFEFNPTLAPAPKNSYWKYESKGEKNSSIMVEAEAINSGDKILFSNHGGSAKTNVFSIKGQDNWQSEKGKGIPDLVVWRVKEKVLEVIEAKQAKSYDQGVEECKTKEYDDWIERELLKPNDLKPECVKKTICTYGNSILENQKHIEYNLNLELELISNKSFSPIKYKDVGFSPTKFKKKKKIKGYKI
jgi:hypothetical protein